MFNFVLDFLEDLVAETELQTSFQRDLIVNQHPFKQSQQVERTGVSLKIKFDKCTLSNGLSQTSPTVVCYFEWTSVRYSTCD